MSDLVCPLWSRVWFFDASGVLVLIFVANRQRGYVFLARYVFLLVLPW